MAVNTTDNNDLEREFMVQVSKGDMKKIKDIAQSIAGNDKNKLKTLINTRHPLGGWTALHSAACNNQLEAVQWLIENGADINTADQYYPQMRTIGFLDVANVRSREFSHHVNQNLDCRGWTPLHYAVGFGNVQVVEYLLNKGANPKSSNLRGHAPEKYIDNSTTEGRQISKLFEDAKSRQGELERAERVKFPLEQKLSSVMVGQTMAIVSVAGAIRRRQNGWHDEDKPLVFMFLGSSGVGKTMLAKCVAEYLNTTNDSCFIRVDMSEYSHQHEVSKFIGAPPGYIGYEEGGQLTEKLKKCPNAVVLLDEVEKAHPDLLTILLQVFDEGRLTDGHGKTVDCRNAIFIMTSNLVQDEIHSTDFKIRSDINLSDEKLNLSEISEVLKETKKFTQFIVQPILKRHFKRDEFLGRINDFVIFHPFNEQDLHAIVTTELNKWKLRALKRHNITITWEEEIVQPLMEAFNPSYGFRSIKHEVERQVINRVAAEYEQEKIKVGCTVHLGLAEDKQSVIVKNVTFPEEKQQKGWLGW